MSVGRLTFLMLTGVFVALNSLSFVVGKWNGVGVESVNGTRTIDAKIASSAEVTDANATFTVSRPKVTELPGDRTMSGSGATGTTLNTEKSSRVRNGEARAKSTIKTKTGRAQSGDDEEDEEEEENDDYYDDKGSNATNIVDAPCPQGLQRDPNGTCRQHIMLGESLTLLIAMTPLIVSYAIDASANRTVEESVIPKAIETLKVVIENPQIVEANGTIAEMEAYINIEGLLSEEEFKERQKTTTERNTEKLGERAKKENATYIPVVPYNIVDGPCAGGMKVDAKGQCRQAL